MTTARIPLALALTAATTLGVAGACVDPAAVRSDEAPIIGGTPSTTDDAVVLLVSWPADRSYFLTCTGVLIAPTVVLTVAHCIDAANHPGHVFAVFAGDDASAYLTVDQLEPDALAVAAVHPHPAYDPAPPFTADIGVVELAAPLTGVEPLPISREAPTAAAVGAPARIVGYGQIVYGEYNARRYAATTVIAGLDPDDTVRVGDVDHRTCLGDSGSPALVLFGGVEAVVGVDSYTDTSGCTEPAHFRRTDAYLPFLDDFLVPVAGPDAGPGAGDVDAGDPGDAEDAGGCCSTGGDGAGASALALGVAALLTARGRRRRHASRMRGVALTGSRTMK